MPIERIENRENYKVIEKIEIIKNIETREGGRSEQAEKAVIDVGGDREAIPEAHIQAQ